MNKVVAVIGLGLVSGLTIYCKKKVMNYLSEIHKVNVKPQEESVVQETPVQQEIKPKEEAPPPVRRLKPEEIVHSEKWGSGTVFYTWKNGTKLIQRFVPDEEQPDQNAQPSEDAEKIHE